jgi:uncharacterized protein (TIGR02598 family)
LVEVTLALGIMAFSLVSILGLVPSGLATFRAAMNASVGAQIVQQIVSDLRQTDWQNVAELQDMVGEPRYYDDQGRELDADAQSAIYRVEVTVAAQDLGGVASDNLARAVVEISRHRADAAPPIARYPVMIAKSL